MSAIHFSVDDVKGIFKVLITEYPKSIFETRTLKFLKSMHDIYGISVDMYCTYQHNWYCIEKVPRIYREQFEENKWLRFGYHCYDENLSVFEDELNFKKYYDLFQKNIFSITGQNQIVNPIRLDRFAGSENMCAYLKQSGVNCILTADDERNSYYLSAIENATLSENFQYYDEKNDIFFIRTCTRLENFVKDDFSDLENELRLYMDKKCDMIPVFSHEYLMDRKDVRNRFERCCQLSLGIS